MNDARFLRVIAWSLRAWFRPWIPIAVGALFLFIGWRSASQVVDVARSAPTPMTANVWDGFLVSFMGPEAWSAAPLAMLPWFVSHLFFLYLIGDLANGELLQRGYAVVPLIGSRLRWWWGKVVTLLVITVGYTLLSLAAVLIVSAVQLPWSWQISALLKAEAARFVPDDLGVEALLGWTFLLFGSTLFTMTSLQILLSIVWRHSFYGLTAISIIAIFSWLLGIGNPSLVRWLPGSQSMLLRHTFFDPKVPGFSLEWSLLYNAILAVGAISVGIWYVRQMDIFGPSAVEIA